MNNLRRAKKDPDKPGWNVNLSIVRPLREVKRVVKYTILHFNGADMARPLTRQMLYPGLSPAKVQDSVLRAGLRPELRRPATPDAALWSGLQP